MIDVVIDLNLHHEGPTDDPSTRLYIYNHPIDPLAAEGTVIIANRIEKNIVPVKQVFERQRKNRNDTPIWMDRHLQRPQYSV